VPRPATFALKAAYVTRHLEEALDDGMVMKR
jgi:hypothetical protein